MAEIFDFESQIQLIKMTESSSGDPYYSNLISFKTRSASQINYPELLQVLVTLKDQ